MNIDILLPYDHFDIENLEHICHGLHNQQYSDFILKILIDPVQKQQATEILAKYPTIKHELYEYKIFNVVDLEYSAMAKAEIKFSNLNYDQEKLIHQHFTKIISYQAMVQILSQYANADYVAVIDGYSYLNPKHLLNLSNAIAQHQPDIAMVNSHTNGYLFMDFDREYVHATPKQLNLINMEHDPDILITQTKWYYQNNQFANLSAFLFSNSFFKQFIKQLQNKTLSKFGLYWSLMFQSYHVNYQHLNQTSVSINIDRNVDFYTFDLNGTDFATELRNIFADNQQFLDTLPTITPALETDNFRKNEFQPLTNEYWQHIPKFNHNLEPTQYNNVLVSIGIPCYNKQDDLKLTLNSIMNQTYKNLEIICVNDKSTDKTLEILNKYAKLDPRIKVIDHPENLGLSGARNTIIDHATGQYLQFTDAGDVLRLDTIEKCLQAFKQHSDIELVLFQAAICNNKKTDKILNCILSAPNSETGNSGVFNAQTMPNAMDFASACIWLYKTEYLKQHNLRFKLGIKHEDNVFAWHVHSMEPKFYFIAETLYYYIILPNSIVTSAISKHDLTILQFLEDKPNLFPNNRHLRIQAYSTQIHATLKLLFKHWLINAKNDDTDEVIAIKNQALYGLRNDVFTQHQEYLPEMTMYWVTLKHPFVKIYVMNTLYIKFLNEHDFNLFIQYLHDITKNSINAQHFAEQLNPNYIFNSDYNINKEQLRLFKRIFKAFQKIDKYNYKQHKAQWVIDFYIDLKKEKSKSKPLFTQSKFVKAQLKKHINLTRARLYRKLINIYINKLFKQK